MKWNGFSVTKKVHNLIHLQLVLEELWEEFSILKNTYVVSWLQVREDEKYVLEASESHR